VLNKRLSDREFIGGDYSIADMACYPWVVPYQNHGQNIDDFPHLKRWLETIRARPATERAYAKAKEVNPNFGQPAIHRGRAQDSVRTDRGGRPVAEAVRGLTRFRPALWSWHGHARRFDIILSSLSDQVH
jgi:ferric-dicitrate binding protein FerR (iron transport regulator)